MSLIRRFLLASALFATILVSGAGLASTTAPADAAGLDRSAQVVNDQDPATFYTFQWTDCFSNGWCRVTTAVCSDEATFTGNPCKYYYYWYQWANK